MQRLMDSPHALRPGRRLKTSVYLREPIASAISGMHHMCLFHTKWSLHDYGPAFELDEVLQRVRSGARATYGICSRELDHQVPLLLPSLSLPPTAASLVAGSLQRHPCVTRRRRSTLERSF